LPFAQPGGGRFSLGPTFVELALCSTHTLLFSTDAFVGFGQHLASLPLSVQKASFDVGRAFDRAGYVVGNVQFHAIAPASVRAERPGLVRSGVVIPQQFTAAAYPAAGEG
jgi:hypothetical protein